MECNSTQLEHIEFELLAELANGVFREVRNSERWALLKAILLSARRSADNVDLVWNNQRLKLHRVRD